MKTIFAFPKLIPLLFLSLFLFAPPGYGVDQYYCPMKCEGAKTYPAPGSCPKCGMPLEKMGGTQPVLNSLDYRLDLTSLPKPPAAKKKVTLNLALKRTKDNSTVKEVEPTHTKPMHLIIVPEDLSDFAHLHPTQSADGSFQVETVFSAGGNYLLYADVTPKGDKNQVFPKTLTVEGTKKNAVKLTQSSDGKQKVGGLEISLKTEPKPIAGTPVTLIYRLEAKGKPVKDLSPYLGALGHSVIISEDTALFLHAHPEAHDHEHEMNSNVKGGPEVAFTVVFPKAGLYKTWAQFNRKGKTLTSTFVVDVK